MVVGQELFGPGQDGVDDVVKLGELAGGVEISEPVQGSERAVVVVGLIEAVQVGEGVPRAFEAGMSGEQLVEAFRLLVVEVVGSAQQEEPSPEDLRILGGLRLASGFTAFGVPGGCRSGLPSPSTRRQRNRAGAAPLCELRLERESCGIADFSDEGGGNHGADAFLAQSGAMFVAQLGEGRLEVLDLASPDPVLSKELDQPPKSILTGGSVDDGEIDLLETPQSRFDLAVRPIWSRIGVGSFAS